MKADQILRSTRWLVVSAMLVGGPMTIAAHAVTMSDVVAACAPCHGLIVNGVVISEDPGSYGFTKTVNGRNQARWLRTINEMIGLGAEVADVDGMAAYLAGLGVPVATPAATTTAGVSPTATPSPTPPLTASACTGDCDGSGEVTVNELVTMVSIALGNAALSTCTAGDADGSGDITINEIIAAVNYALGGCPP